jgi:hypothetical protein
MRNLRQPLLGVVASAVIIIVSLLFISLFSYASLSGWVSYILQCLIPAQIMVAVLWKCERPSFAAKQRQPLKGLVLLLITGLAGAIIAPTFFYVAGGGIAPPTPMLAHATIISVAFMFWLAIMWGGWPFNALIRNPVAAGVATLAACYGVALVLFRIFFDYGFMREAPVYVASLDPHGLFNAWSALVVCVTALAVMFLTLHFDLWPMTKAVSIMRQPVLGVVWTVIAVAIGGGLFEFGTAVLHLDPVVFLVHVPIPFIFGTIIVLNMLQNSLFGKLSQPLKGLANSVTAIIIGTGLALVFGLLAASVTGPLTSGPPAYESEIWLASALLSVTFPFLIFFAEFFRFWPLKKG